MNKRILPALLTTLSFFSACKQNDKADSGKFFPVISFINSQVAHVDSSFYTISKIVSTNDHSDTVFVKREEFRNLASDFLSLPDISEKKLSKMYQEERLFDQTLNRAIFSYTPAKENIEIQKQEVVIMPDPAGDKVKNIIISTIKNDQNTIVKKNLLWQVNESFQVVKTILEENKPERTEVLKVVWNRKED